MEVIDIDGGTREGLNLIELRTVWFSAYNAGLKHLAIIGNKKCHKCIF